MIRIFIGADHAGYDMKQKVLKYLVDTKKYILCHYGCYEKESCDYPDIVKRLCSNMTKKNIFQNIIISKKSF